MGECERASSITKSKVHGILFRHRLVNPPFLIITMSLTSKAKWFSSPAPIKILPRNPRHVVFAPTTSTSIATPPKIISSKELPQRIRTIVAKALWLHKLRQAEPIFDPKLAQNGQWRPDAAATEPTIDEQGREHVEIPNPCVLYKYPVEDFHPFPREEVKTELRRLIPHRVQKTLLAQHPAWCLPPSPINPIENVPSIRWDENKYTGTILHWVGEWSPKAPKGIYANRGVIFKGKRRERERDAKKEELAERVAGMDERIAKWKSVSLAAYTALLA